MEDGLGRFVYFEFCRGVSAMCCTILSRSTGERYFQVLEAAYTTLHLSLGRYLINDGKIVYADYKGTTEKQAETILAELTK